MSTYTYYSNSNNQVQKNRINTLFRGDSILYDTNIYTRYGSDLGLDSFYSSKTYK